MPFHTDYSMLALLSYFFFWRLSERLEAGSIDAVRAERLQFLFSLDAPAKTDKITDFIRGDAMTSKLFDMAHMEGGSERYFFFRDQIEVRNHALLGFEWSVALNVDMPAI